MDCLLAVQVFLTVGFPLGGQGLGNMLHSVHTKIPEPLLVAVVGIQVIIAIIPKQGVRADNVLSATLGISSMVIGGGRSGSSESLF